MPYIYKKRPAMKKRKVVRRRKKRYFKVGKQKYTGRKIELLSIKTLKPTTQIKRFIYYNAYEVRNHLIGGSQNSQFISFNINSPWVAGDSTYANQGTNTWLSNKGHVEHTNTNVPSYGSQYPLLYDTAEAIGYGYQDCTVTGAKFTVKFTPIANDNNDNKCGQTVAFAVLHSQGNAATMTNATNINTLQTMPYTVVRKVEGNQSAVGLNGNTKSASITIKYSPKKFNGLKSLRDNSQMNANVTSQNFTTSQGHHPAEKDRITIGICNALVTPAVQMQCCPVMIEVKMEAVIMLREPFANQNTDVGIVP